MRTYVMIRHGVDDEARVEVWDDEIRIGELVHLRHKSKVLD